MLTALAVAGVLLTGCNRLQQSGYPSLLPRPIESADRAEPMREPVAAAPDADLDRAIAAIDERLSGAITAFDAQAEQAERAARAAAGMASGSESWIAAQVALSELDVLRSATSGIVADIERLMIDRATSGATPYPALDALHARATARATAERDRITAIEQLVAPA